MDTKRRLDVAIVGAGFTGLNAARELVRLGATVQILEARERIGGRIFTGADGRELGCAVLSGPAPLLERHSLWSEAGLRNAPMPRGGEGAVWCDGEQCRGFADVGSPIMLAQRCRASYPGLKDVLPSDASVSALVGSVRDGGVINDWYTQVTGDPCTPASIAFTDEIYAYHGRGERLVIPNMTALPRALSHGLDVRLGCPVTSLRVESSGLVRLAIGTGEVLAARSAIVTVPPPVVARGCLEAGRERAALARELGGANVCVATVGLHAPLPRTVFAYVSTTVPCFVLGVAGDPHVTVTAKGPRASLIADERIVRSTAQRLVSDFPEIQVTPTGSINWHDWGTDHFCFGGLPLASASADACRAWLEPEGPIAWASDVEPAGVSLLERALRASNSAVQYVAEILR